MAPGKEYDGSAIRDDGAENLFTSIGQRVRDLEIDHTVNIKHSNDETSRSGEDRAEAKVIDKIESLCMSCGENVSFPQLI